MNHRSPRLNHWIVLLTVVCLLLGFGPIIGPVLAAEKIIKIGTIFPLTGPVALAGPRCKAAVETAVDILNNKNPKIKVPLADKKGWLEGYKFVLVHTDSQGKPDVGKAEAERLINQEGVWAIIGAYNSSVSMPASLVAERAKKIFMCGASSSAALTQRMEMKYFFRTASTDEVESHEFIEVLQWLNKTQKNADIKTLGIIYENSVFGKNASQQAKKAAAAGGFNIIADVAFSPGATNLDSEVQTLKSKNPDALFGAVLGADYALMVKTMKKMSWLPKVALSYCSGYQDPVISKQLGADADFFMGSTGYSPEFAGMMPAVAEVENIFKTKTGGVPYDSDSIQETIAMLVLAQAIEKAKSLDPTKVAETLYANTWDSPLSLSGKVAFVPGGQNKLALSIVTQLQEGRYKKVFPPEKADTKPVFPMKPWDKR
jgi:branched-chain amino acid transport system substrate-binding protein